MATETLRTDRVRHDKEARQGSPTLSIYRDVTSEGVLRASSFKGLINT
jgi:hypothetical protein